MALPRKCAQGISTAEKPDTVARIPIPRCPKPFKRFPRAGVGIIENGRTAATRRVVYGQQIRTVARVTVPGWARQYPFILSQVLRERRIQELYDRNVKTIQPEDRMFAVISVVVPRHGRRDDEITLMHDCAFAVDVGVGSGQFYYSIADSSGTAESFRLLPIRPGSSG